ncbi:hypothetical protein AQ505_01855 [Pedobacter sp. PACM 27299]|nr:hypothetical protein AQ505_01855 [Pedobacter sp. PACM 27299]
MKETFECRLSTFLFYINRPQIVSVQYGGGLKREERGKGKKGAKRRKRQREENFSILNKKHKSIKLEGKITLPFFCI